MRKGSPMRIGGGGCFLLRACVRAFGRKMIKMPRGRVSYTRSAERRVLGFGAVVVLERMVDLTWK